MSNQKGKILYILHWFPALSETFILREILELQKLGEEIDVATLNPSPDSVSHPEVSQFRGNKFEPFKDFASMLKAHFYWIVKAPQKYFSILFEIISKISHPKTVTVSLRVFCRTLSLCYQLMDSDYRRIHAHFGNAAATGAWIASQLLGIPYSFTAHAIDIFVPDKLLRKKIDDAAFVVVISKYNADYLKKEYPGIDASKLKLVHCGVNTDEFVFNPPALPKSPSRILSVGRMVEKKGFEYLIKAVKLLIDSGRKVNLTLVGGGPLLEQLKELSKQNGLDDIVTFTGPLPGDKVKQLMSEADIFVLPSVIDKRGDRDGIPVVLMESLAMGIPTVSAEVSGIPELVKNFETGLIVDEKNPRSLADALMFYLFETDLRKRLPVAGRKLVETEFNIKNTAIEMQKLFGESR